jgi:hypothetical protein
MKQNKKEVPDNFLKALKEITKLKTKKLNKLTFSA